MQRNYFSPYFICFTEHHLKEIGKLSLEGYTLASSFCRKISPGGGVCILILKYSLKYQPTDLSQFCHEKTLEIRAVKLHLELIKIKLIVFCIYRAPTGILEQFFSLMEKILNYTLQPNVTFLICGDLNINLLTKSNDASKLLTLMNTFNLTQVVDFPTRISNRTESLLDTIFIDTTTYEDIQIKPYINGLSDPDAQIICLKKIKPISKQKAPKVKLTLINDTTIKFFSDVIKGTNVVSSICFTRYK
jgi:exonuclease III